MLIFKQPKFKGVFMKTTKILLGRINNENIYLSKHTWDCGWYWGFGYVGNSNCHFHIDSLINERDYGGNFPSPDVNKVFENPEFTQNQWWVIRDLFVQAYALKQAAEVFRHGGYQTSKKGITDILKDTNVIEVIDDALQTQMLAQDFLNKKLEIVLDTVWQYMIDSIEENKQKEE